MQRLPLLTWTYVKRLISYMGNQIENKQNVKQHFFGRHLWKERGK